MGVSREGSRGSWEFLAMVPWVAKGLLRGSNGPWRNSRCPWVPEILDKVLGVLLVVLRIFRGSWGEFSGH